MASILGLGIGTLGLFASLATFAIARRRKGIRNSGVRSWIPEAISTRTNSNFRWWTKNTGTLDKKSPIIGNNVKNKSLSDSILAFATAWVATLALFIITLHTVIIPSLICIGLTLSCGAILIFLHRRKTQTGLRKLREVISMPAALALVILTGFSLLSWSSQLAEPKLSNQIASARQASNEYSLLRARQAEETARIEALQAKIAAANVAKQDLDQAQQNYDRAARDALCELDGTCGTGKPGAGRSYVEKQEIANGAKAIRNAAESRYAELNQNFGVILSITSDKQLSLSRTESNLIETAEAARKGDLGAQFNTLSLTLFSSQLWTLSVVMFLLISIFFIHRVRREKIAGLQSKIGTPRTDGNGEDGERKTIT